VDELLERELIALLERAKQGDKKAYGRFFDLTVQATLASVQGLVPADRVEATLTRVYEAAWRALPSYSSEVQSASVWLNGICREVARGVCGGN
jgi:hypothetical protein